MPAVATRASAPESTVVRDVRVSSWSRFFAVQGSVIVSSGVSTGSLDPMTLTVPVADVGPVRGSCAHDENDPRNGQDARSLRRARGAEVLASSVRTRT